jgi:ribonucleoside-diphosphate reductase alpha chain
MKFTRLLTRHDGAHVAEQIKWKKVRAEIRDDRTGTIIFAQDDVEVPDQWSDRAVNILAQKYFRKAGVPDRVTTGEWLRGDTHYIPEVAWLFPQIPARDSSYGGETSARQVFHRLAGCWTYWGWNHGYFDTPGDARVFYNETYMMLALQMAAPNSPQWFNTGLHWAYGITSEDEGQWSAEAPSPMVDLAADLATEVSIAAQISRHLLQMPERGDPAAHRVTNPYERPQVHACFLTGTEDNLVGDHGIMATWKTEARIFKYGSGSGVNVSPWRARGERLSGGGVASGVMSWLRIGDSSAGAVQSGGTTRRAAKMVMLDDDHPELIEFIDWKAREEAKAASMYVGSSIIKMFAEGELPEALHHLVPKQTRERLAQGFPVEVLGIGYEEEANRSIDGQNSNNSVRLSDDFMRRLGEDAPWSLSPRGSSWVEPRVVRSTEVWERLCRAAWASADPGVIFDDIVNDWNTCAADGRITTTNPCSEFHFLTWAACNLASLRLTAFLHDNGEIGVRLFEHVCRLVTIILDISVTMASYPAPEFARSAHQYRTLGIGYSDLGSLLMQLGLSYDSEEGRALAAALTALMTGVAYRTSAEMAESLGPFPRWEANQESFRAVMLKHERALHNNDLVDWSKLNKSGKQVFTAASSAWGDVGRSASFRNAQASLIAPTGTISFSMDCDTTGLEPEFALVRTKSLAGGGTMRLTCRALGPALQNLGYSDAWIAEFIQGLEAGGHLRDVAPFGNHLLDEHAGIFACSQDLSPEAHIRMLAATQRFLSGAASKTINLPNDATPEDVSRAFLLCHQLGIKAVAIYRDGSKLAQPMLVNTTRESPARTAGVEAIKSVSVKTSDDGSVRLEPGKKYRVSIAADPPDDDAPLARGEREFLPWRRTDGYTQKARIGDHGYEQTIFWRVGTFPDGRPGELFITLAKQGSMQRATAEALAVAISIGLQHGVPLSKYVDQFMGVKFEPAGYVEGVDEIRFASSYIDLIMRDLAVTYLGRDDLRRTVVMHVVDDPEKIVALDRAGMAMASGSRPTGDPCRSCGGELVQTGRCRQCLNCNWNEGCAG